MANLGDAMALLLGNEGFYSMDDMTGSYNLY